MNNDTNNEIIEVLLEYLPKLSVSMNTIMNYINNALLQEDDSQLSKAKEQINDELKVVIPSLAEFYEGLTYDKLTKNITSDEISMMKSFDGAMNDVLAGLGIMLDWVLGDTDDDDDIKRAINCMYLGTQGIMKVVNEITDEK
ncbi:hypothetical protein P5815_22050 [Bacillus cereus]|uniref:hypothetical protein n=1 Tax=Bacillus TaxID=1386 RepID=UPI001F61F2B4|nr:MULTISPECIES: hypothetical protein [Bacillus]MDF9523215.1 hypothetical protein [Bacillus cereus]MDF9561911.1 hypothetical protein [Bacillus cereus]UNT68386.1 hypothetical protein IQ781_23470 [Bacillus sp. N447-1]